jgi:hypothetical protein
MSHKIHRTVRTPLRQLREEAPHTSHRICSNEQEPQASQSSPPASAKCGAPLFEAANEAQFRPKEATIFSRRGLRLSHTAATQFDQLLCWWCCIVRTKAKLEELQLAPHIRQGFRKEPVAAFNLDRTIAKRTWSARRERVFVHGKTRWFASPATAPGGAKIGRGRQ